MDNKQLDIMSNAPAHKAILKLSLPVVFGMMIQVLYNLVDTFFIGMLKDENQLAAANITMPIIMILMAIATIVSTGAASYISRSIGKKDFDAANKTLSTGVFICTGLAVVVTIIGIFNLKQIVIGLGASDKVYSYAYQYSLVMLVGAIPIMLNYCGGQLIRAEGAVMPSITGMLIGTVVNIILDPIFIFLFKMEIQGAAIATVLGNLSSVIYYMFFYLKGKSILKLRHKNLSFLGEIWKEIFVIGTPAALSQFLMSIAVMFLNNLAKGYGDNALAGMGVSSKIILIGSFIFMGFAAGTQPLVGYNYGAKNIERVHNIIKTAMLMTFSIGIVLTILFWILAKSLVSMLTPLPLVIEQGVFVLRISLFSFVVLGPQMLATTGIQAFGKAKEALILSIARQGLFYIPLLFVMKNSFGFAGLIWAQPISDGITLLVGLFFLGKILNKCMKEQIELKA